MNHAALATVLASALALVSVPARAAERVALANGFEMRCHHHEIVDGRVRLYLGDGQASYIDMRPAEIASFTPVADLPPPTPATQSPAAKNDARLTATDLRQMLGDAGQAHNLDVDLLAAVVKAESGNNVHAVSPAGARGLMQLMPSTAAGLGVSDVFEPGQNLRGGSAYLDSLLVRYHDNLSLALAAYNSGPAAVDRYRGIPPYHETRAYVARVIHEFNRRVRARLAQPHPLPQPQQASLGVSATSPQP